MRALSTSTAVGFLRRREFPTAMLHSSPGAAHVFSATASCATATACQWDPSLDLRLHHPTLLLLEKHCNSPAHFNQILAQMMRLHLTADTFPISRLLAHSTAASRLSLAFRLFTHFAPSPNLFIYNLMISAFSSFPRQSCDLYKSMLSSSVALDERTFLSLLKSASKNALFGRQIHAHVVVCGFSSLVYLQNTLMKMYLDAGDAASARHVFDHMPEQDLVSCNIMLSGLAKEGRCVEALELLRYMEASGIELDEYTMVGLLVCCCQLKNARLGKAVHGMITRKMALSGGSSNSCLILNNALIYIYMSETGELSHGRCIHGSVHKGYGALDAFLGSALIDMYSKCGSIERSLVIFNHVSKKDVTLWTAMITGLAFHGYGAKAMELFVKMQEEGLMPNKVTLVAALTACSHAGLVDQGTEIFKSMKQRYNVEPGKEHYGCMVDLFARAGQLKEALHVVESMPMKPTRSIWGAILSTSKAHANLELAEHALTELLKLEPEEEGGYVLLSNAYAACGMWSSSDRVREMMERMGVKKIGGCSSLLVDGVVHEFISSDKRHRFWPEIYDTLNYLHKMMKIDEERVQ
ncbi:pentatricopeptide repeat-containing protein At5g56310-like [Zingiber officinale]|uniref:pentatricopeptide repeat-containing protein At5g56310-like n=1 Tax=Zingiber officinale TaxID=94328 RepID=UPI001C4B6D61|nr:pentatricopeptide repeat-containing protein At5g56310-like [Zingiber officinale]